MSVDNALVELRRKKQHVERAIRALELLQQLEQTGQPADANDVSDRKRVSNLIEMPRFGQG